jgi:hypothetical protein
VAALHPAADSTAHVAALHPAADCTAHVAAPPLQPSPAPK